MASASLPESQGSAASLDACAILTPAEVAAALGVAVDAGARVKPTETRCCTWHQQGNKQLRNVRASFTAEQQHEIVKTPGSGIGDDAYFSTAKGMVFNLSVATYFRIMTRSNAEVFAKSDDAAIGEQDKEVDLKIARAKLSKLYRAPFR